MAIRRRRRVIVTAGPTREHIAPVRYISNESSGKMGFAIARAAQARGDQVTLIAGPVDLGHALGQRIEQVQALEGPHAAARLPREEFAENVALHVLGYEHRDGRAPEGDGLLGVILDGKRAVPELVQSSRIEARGLAPGVPVGKQELGGALAHLDPGDEEGAALLDDYHRARELYESPVAAAAFALALGDAYVRADKLPLALAEYQQAADPEGLLRAGCVALELDLTDRAAAIWARLRELSDEGEPHEATAALMLGELSPEAFRQKVRDAWKAPLVNYLVGLRLWSEADDAADEALAKARAAEGEWFSPLAARPRSPFAHPAPTVP